MEFLINIIILVPISVVLYLLWRALRLKQPYLLAVISSAFAYSVAGIFDMKWWVIIIYMLIVATVMTINTYAAHILCERKTDEQLRSDREAEDLKKARKIILSTLGSVVNKNYPREEFECNEITWNKHPYLLALGIKNKFDFNKWADKLVDLRRNDKRTYAGEVGELICGSVMEELSCYNNILTNVRPTIEFQDYITDTEADIVCVSELGVFVVEAKNYRADIKYALEAKDWTVNHVRFDDNHVARIEGEATTLKNPAMQNVMHIKAISKYIWEKLHISVPIYDWVMFTQTANLTNVGKTDNPPFCFSKVGNTDEYRALIKQTANRLSPILSKEQVDSVTAALKEISYPDRADASEKEAIRDEIMEQMAKNTERTPAFYCIAEKDDVQSIYLYDDYFGGYFGRCELHPYEKTLGESIVYIPPEEVGEVIFKNTKSNRPSIKLRKLMFSDNHSDLLELSKGM